MSDKQESAGPYQPTVRPVHVEFWRCGKAQKGAGWSRCPAPDLCKKYGCEKIAIERLRAQADG